MASEFTRAGHPTRIGAQAAVRKAVCDAFDCVEQSGGKLFLVNELLEAVADELVAKSIVVSPHASYSMMIALRAAKLKNAQKVLP